MDLRVALPEHDNASRGEGRQTLQRYGGDAGPGAGLLLWLLLAADGLFIAVHVWAAEARPGHRLLSIEADNGYPELFQYLKFFWLALLMALLAWRTRAFGCLSWSALFLYLLLDDLLRLHEDGGAALAEAWELPALLGLRPKDLGELAVTGGAALVLLPAIALAWRSGGPVLRNLLRRLAWLLALLVLVGVGLDLLASAWHPTGWARLLLGLLEDGGEMVVASLMLAVAFGALQAAWIPAPAGGSAKLSASAGILGEPPA
jgi:hypothetical protein